MASDRRTNSQPARQIEEAFAKANEKIRASAERSEFVGLVPFLCECSRVSCTETIRLSLTTYRELRGRGDVFILLAGQADLKVERVIMVGAGYVLVEKFA
jgi:hypothetical protein